MPSVWSHDLTIEDAGSATPIFGYMLAKNKNGAGKLVIKDARTIAPRFLTTDQLTESQFPPDIELVWTQTDWTKGLGGIRDADHPGYLGSGFKVDTSQPGKIVLARNLVGTTLNTAPDAYAVSGFAIVGTEVAAFSQRDVYNWNYGTTSWDILTEPEAAVKFYRNGVVYEGNTYAPAWDTNNAAATYIYKADADAQWTLSTLSQAFKYMVVVQGAGGPILVGGNQGGTSTHVIRRSVDGTNTGSWDAISEVGGPDAAITGLLADVDVLLVLKTNGIWSEQPDGSFKNLTPQVDAHPDNFKGAITWNGHVLLPLGGGGLMELVGNELRPIGLSVEGAGSRETQLHGRVVEMAGNSTELYIMVHESGQSRYHILKGVERDPGGRLGFYWSHIARQAYTTGTDDDRNALFAESVPSGTTVHRRLLVGINSSGSNLSPYYIPASTDVGDVYNPGDDGEAMTVIWDKGMPRVPAHLSTIALETDNLGSGANDHYFEVLYRINGIGGARAGNGVTGWTYVTGTQSTSRLSTDQPTLTFAREITGRLVELLFIFYQGTTTTTTPELHKFTLVAQIRPSSLKTIPLSLTFTDGQMMVNGTEDGRVAASLVQLRTWSEGAAEVVVTLPNTADLTATRTFSCVFLPGYHREETVIQEGGRFPEVVTFDLLAEVST